MDAMLGGVGMKRVEYELDDGVERWGARLIRRGFGERFGEEWKKEMEEVGGWRLGWEGRVIRGAMRDRLEGEEWDMEVERGGLMKWKIVIGKGKKKAKHQENVKTTPGPPRGVMVPLVPLVLLVHPDPP